MDLTSSKRVYHFDEPFCNLFKIKLLQRKSPASPFELHDLKLTSMAAAAVLVHVLTSLMSLVKSFQEPQLKLSDISEAGAIASVFLIPFFRGIALLVNHRVVRRLLHNLENLFPITRQDQVKHHLHGYAKTILLKNKIMKLLCTFGTIVFLIIAVLKSCFDWMIRGQPYPYRYPFISWYPFNDNLLFWYPLVYCFQGTVCLSAALLFFNEDLIFSTAVTQLCMHYRYLSELLSQLDARIESRNSQELKKLIRYHYALQSLGNDVDEIFSLSTFIGFTFMKISMCMFLFNLFHGIDVTNMLPFMTALLILIVPLYLRCSSGADLCEASASLIDSIYDHNWYEGTPKYRKLIAIMMMRANRPVMLHASGLNHICMAYFKEVIMQTYQIFMFLHNSSATSSKVK